MIQKLFFYCVMVISIISSDAKADLGPKPHFIIYLDKSVSKYNDIELVTCQTNTCENPRLFEEMGPQRFMCHSEDASCFVMAYGFPPYLMLRVHMNGKTYNSHSFKPNGDIDVNLIDEKLIVKTRSWFKWLWN